MIYNLLSAASLKILDRTFRYNDMMDDREYVGFIDFNRMANDKFRVVSVVYDARDGTIRCAARAEFDTIGEAEREIEAQAWHFMVCTGEAD